MSKMISRRLIVEKDLYGAILIGINKITFIPNEINNVIFERVKAADKSTVITFLVLIHKKHFKTLDF